MGICCSNPAADEAREAARRRSIAAIFVPVDCSQPLEHSLLGRKYPDDLSSKYIAEKVLGRGKYGVTHAVTSKADGTRWACKSVGKVEYIAHQMEHLPRQELQMMELLAGSPHTLRLREALEDQQYVHFVMELCEGGDLVDKLFRIGKYSEQAAAECVRDVLTAVAYMHDMGVLHRDVKLENFLYTKDPAKGGVLKVIDYGMSVFYRPGQRFNDIVGTSYYMPPEMCACMMDSKATYGEAVDVWAVGVVMYMMLSGEPPFPGKTDAEVLEAIQNRPPNLYEGVWISISKEAVDLLQQMLQRDPQARPTPRALLRHPWLAPGGAPARELEPEVLQRLKRFATTSRLKRAALKVVSEKADEDELRGLRALFESLDRNRDGQLSVTELRMGLALQLADKPVPANNPFKRISGLMGQGLVTRRPSIICPALGQDLVQILSSADLDGDGYINWEEFLVAMMSGDRLQQDDQIRAVFEAFDRDKDGRLNLEDLRDALAMGSCHVGTSSRSSGSSSSSPWGSSPPSTAAMGHLQGVDAKEQQRIMEETYDILKSADKDQDGYINYSEFADIMRAGSGTQQNKRTNTFLRKSLTAAVSPGPVAADAATGFKWQQQAPQVMPHVKARVA